MERTGPPYDSTEGERRYRERLDALGMGEDATGDGKYRRHVRAVTGADAAERAGVVGHGSVAAGVEDLAEAEGLSDDSLYRRYRQELNGSAARRRTLEDAKRHKLEAKTVQDARLLGRPLGRDEEHLRPLLADYGY